MTFYQLNINCVRDTVSIQTVSMLHIDFLINQSCSECKREIQSLEKTIMENACSSEISTDLRNRGKKICLQLLQFKIKKLYFVLSQYY